MKTKSNRRSFFKKAGVAGLSLSAFIHASTEASVEYATQKVPRYSSPSDLKITDMRFVHIKNAPMSCPIIRIRKSNNRPSTTRYRSLTPANPIWLTW